MGSRGPVPPVVGAGDDIADTRESSSLTGQSVTGVHSDDDRQRQRPEVGQQETKQVATGRCSRAVFASELAMLGRSGVWMVQPGPTPLHAPYAVLHATAAASPAGHAAPAGESNDDDCGCIDEDHHAGDGHDGDGEEDTEEDSGLVPDADAVVAVPPMPSTKKQSPHDHEVIHVEFHLCYSDAFECPVLLVHATRAGGTLLNADEALQALFRKDNPARGSNQRRGLLSYTSHPALDMPFLFVHPCHTQDMMRVSQTACPTAAYLPLWLSILRTFISLLPPPQQR